MVQLMLAGFGGGHQQGGRNGHGGQPATGAGNVESARGIECYHVNARISDTLQDIGHVRCAKFLMLVAYCLQAIWFRFRYGVKNFYYIPAPGKHTALYRDWLVMFLCRPFFKRVVLHWHAAGLGKWLEREVQIRTRSLTFLAYKHVDLSIVLSHFNLSDAEKLLPKRVLKVPNGIPDPCPDYETLVLPRRRARLTVRRKLLAGEPPSPADLAMAGDRPEVIKVLFLGHCMRQKGLFDALEAVELANEHFVRNALPLRVHLTAAGEFVDAAERTEFERRIQPRGGLEIATYRGFVSGADKRTVLMDSDCLCFPTYYSAESFGLVLVEAMAFGLPIVATRWRALPELFPPNYPGLVDVRAPDQAAAALRGLMVSPTGEDLRQLFIQRFTLDRFLENLAGALHHLEG